MRRRPIAYATVVLSLAVALLLGGLVFFMTLRADKRDAIWALQVAWPFSVWGLLIGGFIGALVDIAFGGFRRLAAARDTAKKAALK